MRASLFRHGLNLWPPYLFAGIHVTDLSADYRRARVELRMRPWNRNYVGTHFGGSLFAMTDPFWMLMVLHHLGRDHFVWDKAGEIEFVKPGRGMVQASFVLDDAVLDGPARCRRRWRQGAALVRERHRRCRRRGGRAHPQAVVRPPQARALIVPSVTTAVVCSRLRPGNEQRRDRQDLSQHRRLPHPAGDRPRRHVHRLSRRADLAGPQGGIEGDAGRRAGRRGQPSPASRTRPAPSPGSSIPTSSASTKWDAPATGCRSIRCPTCRAATWRSAAWPATSRRWRQILRSLLDALDYAHVRGVVHRDVKAENVLFDDADRPMLADFGIALRRGSNPRLTSAGLAVGSTAYMPPEQARGQEVDRRADIYSIGVLTWEMLMGQLPYNAGDALTDGAQARAGTGATAAGGAEALATADRQGHGQAARPAPCQCQRHAAGAGCAGTPQRQGLRRGRGAACGAGGAAGHGDPATLAACRDRRHGGAGARGGLFLRPRTGIARHSQRPGHGRTRRERPAGTGRGRSDWTGRPTGHGRRQRRGLRRQCRAATAQRRAVGTGQCQCLGQHRGGVADQPDRSRHPAPDRGTVRRVGQCRRTRAAPKATSPPRVPRSSARSSSTRAAAAPALLSCCCASGWMPHWNGAWQHCWPSPPPAAKPPPCWRAPAGWGSIPRASGRCRRGWVRLPPRRSR